MASIESAQPEERDPEDSPPRYQPCRRLIRAEELEEESTEDSRQSMLGAHYQNSSDEESSEGTVWAKAVPIPEAFPVEPIAKVDAGDQPPWTPSRKTADQPASSTSPQPESMDSEELMRATSALLNSPEVPPQSSPWKATPKSKPTEWQQ